jgi:hypothetical protein
MANTPIILSLDNLGLSGNKTLLVDPVQSN